MRQGARGDARRQQHFFARLIRRRSLASSSAASFFDGPPPRLRYGLVFGGLASVWPVASHALDLGGAPPPLDGHRCLAPREMDAHAAFVASWLDTGRVRLRAALKGMDEGGGVE